jgi:hypothetical protein
MDTTALIDFLIEAGDVVTDVDVFGTVFLIVVAIVVARGWYRARREGWASAPVDDDDRSKLRGVNPATGAPMVSKGFDAFGNPYGFDDLSKHD